jgi:hypothetical protein
MTMAKPGTRKINLESFQTLHRSTMVSDLVQVLTLFVWFGLVWFGLVWFGLVWSGLVWSGLVWSGLVWSGLVWSGLVWSGKLPATF